MRLFAALLILTLGGCGMAVSDKPIFTDADVIGAPTLENGVWLLSDGERDEAASRCDVDVAQPVSAWPKCAKWALYRDGHWFERDGDTGIATKPVEASVLITGGEIAIVQLRFDDVDLDAPSSGAAASPTYFFAAFADKPDADTAKLRAIDLWMVMCGTEVPTAPGNDAGAAAEFVRFAGFDEQCRPDSGATLRAAAARSLTPDTSIVRLRWARTSLG